MKKIGLFLAVIGMIGSLIGAEAKMLRIPLGSLTVEEVAFKIDNISISSPGVVKVEIISENGRQIRISGLKVGITDVQLLGGGMSQVYKVTVNDDLREKLNSLKRDLDAVPELDISMNNGKLVLKGELSSIANQELKNKVVKAYGSYILDLSTFRPTPEVMLGLQKNFEKAGFKVVRNANESQPGEISISQVGEMLTIAGSVYSEADLKMINSILAAQPWLSINAANSTNSQNKVQAYVNVQVLPMMLQVDVVHIALSQNDIKKLGINMGDFGNLLNGSIDIAGLLGSAYQRNRTPHQTVHTREGAYGMAGSGSLAASLGFLGQNGVTRARRAGFLTFKSNDMAQWRKLHDGGKVWLSSGDTPAGGAGVNVTVTGTLTEVETGLILKVKGGLVGKDTISLDVDQEISYPTAPEFGEKYQVTKTSYLTSIQCKLGETVAIGGLSKFMQTSGASGSIPYLRNIPVFKWLISQDSDEFNTDQVLTLVCVRPMVKSGQIDQVAIELEKMKQAEDKAMKDREADKHKNDGKWYEFWRW